MKKANIVKEDFEVETLSDKMKFFIIYSMVNVTQFHIYHLLATTGQTHDAIKEFYETLQDEIDEVAEYSIANLDLEYSGDDSDYEVQITFDYEDEMVLSEIKTYRSVVTHMLDYLEGNEYASIKNEIVSIQEACDKLIYKMGME